MGLPSRIKGAIARLSTEHRGTRWISAVRVYAACTIQWGTGSPPANGCLLELVTAAHHPDAVTVRVDPYAHVTLHDPIDGERTFSADTISEALTLALEGLGR